ncbi:bifunctional cobalt-precorrin-7 (C(5))-methyltransferase/cobalt-precorrin-6B (C(15))-methyltransferase [Tepidibacillus decaturensis]|uniref:Cobalamin biosynthesis protein CbiE n=1 Tax=Tepidibacillus decaturensis TaxID=1413211 RepID=A0A135L5Z5_9BACI|nr:bifunctional cobalt-precorrin-7 (C(5))-methyltransferase/cobalt-precorrin-6B (C(15))-methyltransferase [Tepidibacillus decaturensis]KXG44337.1 cobalamin biosynthesis protein CbiE [Tepidibacillus decaturensis]
MEKMKIIGIGDDGENGIFPHYRKWIAEADILVGGERQLSYFPDFQKEKWILRGDLPFILHRLKEEAINKKVVVLASGDPLFYGIGRLFLDIIGCENLSIYPHLSSVQLAFARLGDSWQDSYIESLHGRSLTGLAQRIDGKTKIALLTDAVHSPTMIAQYLLIYGFDEYEMFIGEHLGGKNEKIYLLSLEEAGDQTFAPLNIVIMRKRKEIPAVQSWNLGIEDEEFYQKKPKKGLITKKEIRVLSLVEMKLRSGDILWDIGAGSGSVSIEASKYQPDTEVYAIEKDIENIDFIKKNMKKFRTDFTVIHGEAPDCLNDLPDPDVIFVGGSNGRLEEILQLGCHRLKQNGRVIVNAITMETLIETLHFFENRGCSPKITLVQIARSKPIASKTGFESLNPIYIVTATNPKGKRKEEVDGRA